MTIKEIRIGTRKSELALIQTNEVKAMLESKFPDIKIIITDPKDTLGDEVLDEHLKSLSLKNPGLFTKDLEIGLLANQCDCVVHSLKDMPTRLPEGLSLAAISQRKDPRDAFLLRKDINNKYNNISDLPKGSVIGTSSIRREAILREQFQEKEFHFKLIRGNVSKRMEKLDSGDYDATILAVAGLDRMGDSFQSRISQYLDPPQFLYGVSQGALGIECREEDKELIQILKDACYDEVSTFRCLAERSVLRALEGGCQLPLGVSSEYENETQQLTLVARILNEKGSQSVEKIYQTKVTSEEQANEAGVILAKQLLEAGGDKILESIGNYSTGDRNISRPTTYGSAAQPHVEARPSS